MLDGPPPLPPKPAWPKAIGIISIICGALGVLLTPITVFQNLQQAGTTGGLRLMPSWYVDYVVVAAVVNVALRAMLIVAGIVLLLRKPAAQTLHLMFALFGILLPVVVLMAEMSAVYSAKARVLPGAIEETFPALVGATVGAIIYPVFLVVWFLRSSIRRQTAEWRLVTPT